MREDGIRLKDWLTKEEQEQVNKDNFWNFYELASERQSKKEFFSQFYILFILFSIFIAGFFGCILFNWVIYKGN